MDSFHRDNTEIIVISVLKFVLYIIGSYLVYNEGLYIPFIINKA